MDITQLILDDHHEQRRLFAILEQVGRTDTAALSAVWARLGTFLDLHAAAEEAIFYPALLQVGLAAGRGPGRRERPWTPSATTMTSGTRSQRSPVTRPAAMGGSPPSPRRTWPTEITWPRKNARA